MILVNGRMVLSREIMGRLHHFMMETTWTPREKMCNLPTVHSHAPFYKGFHDLINVSLGKKFGPENAEFANNVSLYFVNE